VIRAEREVLLVKLAELAGVQVFPSQANMLLLRLSGPPGRAAAVFEALKARQVLVKNVSTMHPLLANCLRLTVGTAPENTLLLAALEASL
jgi:histidinol-phosphate aminotransferase